MIVVSLNFVYYSKNEPHRVYHGKLCDASEIKSRWRLTNFVSHVSYSYPMHTQGLIVNYRGLRQGMLVNYIVFISGRFYTRDG